jgi:hypothetical protein
MKFSDQPFLRNHQHSKISPGPIDKKLDLFVEQPLRALFYADNKRQDLAEFTPEDSENIYLNLLSR